MNTPRGGPPPPHPFVLGRCGRALDSWRSWRSWCLCVQMCKPSDSRQTLFDFAKFHFFSRIGSTNMGEIVGGISGGSTGGTSSRQHAKKRAKVSQNLRQTLQNRALGPPKSSPERPKTHQNRPRATTNAARGAKCEQEAPKCEKWRPNMAGTDSGFLGSVAKSAPSITGPFGSFNRSKAARITFFWKFGSFGFPIPRPIGKSKNNARAGFIASICSRTNPTRTVAKPSDSK